MTNIDPVLRRIARYAKTWVPHSSATADMVKGDWEKIQRFMAEVGRKPIGNIDRRRCNTTQQFSRLQLRLRSQPRPVQFIGNRLLRTP